MGRGLTTSIKHLRYSRPHPQPSRRYAPLAPRPSPLMNQNRVGMLREGRRDRFSQYPPSSGLYAALIPHFARDRSTALIDEARFRRAITCGEHCPAGASCTSAAAPAPRACCTGVFPVWRSCEWGLAPRERYFTSIVPISYQRSGFPPGMSSRIAGFSVNGSSRAT